MRFALGTVIDESFRFEIAKNRQYRGVREIRRQLVTHFGDGARAEVPQHAHDVELTIAQHEFVPRRSSLLR